MGFSCQFIEQSKSALDCRSNIHFQSITQTDPRASVIFWVLHSQEDFEPTGVAYSILLSSRDS